MALNGLFCADVLLRNYSLTLVKYMMQYVSACVCLSMIIAYCMW